MSSSSATDAVVSDADRATFRRDGAVILRGVLDQTWVELLAEGLDDCVAHPDGMSGSLVSANAEIRIDQFPAARSALLRRFITDSPVASLVGDMLGAPVRFYMDQMFVKPAGEVMATSWHQDTSYYNVDGHDLIRAWVSPDRVPRDVSLEVVRGSHLWNVTYRPLAGRDPTAPPPSAIDEAKVLARGHVVERAGADFAYNDAILDTSLPRTPDIAGHRDSFDIIGWDFEPGDVILFHGNILHGARADAVLEHPRRAHAAMFAGPNVRYLRRPGQVIPDPVDLAAHNPTTGQTLDEFDDVFPLVWAPTPH